MKKILLAAGVALSMLSFQASASTMFQLSSCDLAVGTYAASGPGLSGFDEAICSFAPTTTSSLSISDFGSGRIDPSFHGSYGVAIDLGNGTSWTNIFTSPIFSVDTNLSSILGSPINFSPITANQLRLRSDSDKGWTFHDASGAMQFTLDSAEVPEPATTALFGLGLLGFAASRRKSAKSKNV